MAIQGQRSVSVPQKFQPAAQLPSVPSVTPSMQLAAPKWLSLTELAIEAEPAWLNDDWMAATGCSSTTEYVVVVASVGLFFMRTLIVSSLGQLAESGLAADMTHWPEDSEKVNEVQFPPGDLKHRLAHPIGFVSTVRLPMIASFQGPSCTLVKEKVVILPLRPVVATDVVGTAAKASTRMIDAMNKMYLVFISNPKYWMTSLYRLP